jgi:phage terminase large subunit
MQILFGGSSSGKSKFVAQRAVRDILAGKRNYLCVRKVKNDLRVSVFREIKRVINDWKFRNAFKIDMSTMLITCLLNGRQIMFAGLDDPEKLKSIVPDTGSLTDIWEEEATQLTQDDHNLLKKRLRGLTDPGIKKRITQTFNPINKQHWIFKEFFSKRWDDSKKEYKGTKVYIKHFTYKDNRFLEKDDIEELEDESDQYLYDVYTLGKWGVLGKLIFKNWTIEDLTEIRDTFDYYYHGLDFGFTAPTAYICAAYSPGKKTIYVLDEAGRDEMEDSDIIDMLKPILGDERITCDTNDGKAVRALQNNGIDAVKAKKGRDSLKFGIKWLKDKKIKIHHTCIKTIGEVEIYQNAKTRAGEILDEPVKKNDHWISALRYAMEDEMLASDMRFIR